MVCKRVPFVNRRFLKGVPFQSKTVCKRVRGWASGSGASPYKALLSTPRFPNTYSRSQDKENFRSVTLSNLFEHPDFNRIACNNSSEYPAKQPV